MFGLLKKLPSLKSYRQPTPNEARDAAVIADLASIQNIFEYLDDLAAKDVYRFFAAVDDRERNLVRGAYLRTTYLKKLLATHKAKSLDKKSSV